MPGLCHIHKGCMGRVLGHKHSVIATRAGEIHASRFRDCSDKWGPKACDRLRSPEKSGPYIGWDIPIMGGVDRRNGIIHMTSLPGGQNEALWLVSTLVTHGQSGWECMWQSCAFLKYCWAYYRKMDKCHVLQYTGINSVFPKLSNEVLMSTIGQL